jgi:GTP pyrophosphokinase
MSYATGGDEMDVFALYDELITKIKKYHSVARISLIQDAFTFAREAHDQQCRKSGEPYIIHPLSVAIILAELELDFETIAAGMLHDVVEDTDYTLDDIEKNFGEEIALLVDGLTKLDKMQYTSKIEEQAENYRKMFWAMAEDLRVIIIKIADRLHNMRTLGSLLPEKQIEIAQETLDIYAPLAHRLGISKLRYELEDLSFLYTKPEKYAELANKINLKQSKRTAFINNIVETVQNRLNEENIEAKVEGRYKHFFSIYKKMIAKEKEFDQIYDLFAIRVIVNNNHTCYEVLGFLHDLYSPVPGRIKDYIGIPKSNRYQSLHTTLMCKDGGEPFEVQIRTWEMHRVAEYGVAAHWKYKEGTIGQIDPASEEAKLAWLRKMMEWQRDLSDSEEFLDALKTDLSVFKSNVYCFTPKGQIISLVNGSTPIDFAYAIHSAVGNRMMGARVNGLMVPIDRELATGDRVEIMTSQNVKGPSHGWLNIVKTSQARSKIKHWFKKQNRYENILRGRELLETEAKKLNVSLSELLNDGRDEIIINRFNCVDFDGLCATVGFGGIRETQVISRLYREYEKKLPDTSEEDIIRLIEEAAQPFINKTRSGISVRGVGDSNVRFSKCCGPLPGDEIIGFITRGRGVSIHRSDCINIAHLDELDRRRLIEAEWHLPEKSAESASYHADLRILCDDRDGLLIEIHKFFTDEKVKITTLQVRTEKSDAIFNVGIEIDNSEHLDRICSKLLQKRSIQDISRASS